MNTIKWLNTPKGRFVIGVFLGLSVVFIALDVSEVFARVGGGQSYSGGRSSSSSSSSSSSGGGDLAFFLIWLAIEHPVIGIPLLVLFIIFVIISKVVGKKVGRENVPESNHGQLKPAQHSSADPLAKVVLVDPNFSEPAFIDFVQVVYARIQHYRTTSLDSLQAYLTSEVASELTARSKGIKEVRDVVFGSIKITRIWVKESINISVELETNITEVNTKPQQYLLNENWVFRKLPNLSPSPKTLVAMECPSCGNPAETRLDGSCPHCDTFIGKGRLLWEVTKVGIVNKQEVKPPTLALGSGVEEGTKLPTVFHPHLAARIRAFHGSNPDFDIVQFKSRVIEVFMALQKAWSNDRWEDARPFESDLLFQTHRFWMERYKKFGLKNKLEQITVLDVVLVKVTSDAFYNSITVRVKAKMIDYTIDQSGKLVGGSKTKHRLFTEYWTFIKSVTQSAKSKPLNQCPSCGATLDRISQTGICGYCDAKITTGEFGWILSSIQQDESYRG